jgi:hypothetical protein
LRRDDFVSPYGFNCCSLSPNRVHDPLCPFSNWSGIQRSSLVLFQKSSPRVGFPTIATYTEETRLTIKIVRREGTTRKTPVATTLFTPFVSFPLGSLIRCC